MKINIKNLTTFKHKKQQQQKEGQIKKIKAYYGPQPIILDDLVLYFGNGTSTSLSYINENPEMTFLLNQEIKYAIAYICEDCLKKLPMQAFTLKGVSISEHCFMDGDDRDYLKEDTPIYQVMIKHEFCQQYLKIS